MKYKNINLSDGLTEQTISFIKKYIDNLDRANTLSQLDELSLSLLADSYDTYQKAMAIIREEGLITTSDRHNAAPHPAVKIANDAFKNMTNILKEMSGTIRSRSVIKQIAQETETSPLEEFIKNNG